MLSVLVRSLEVSVLPHSPQLVWVVRFESPALYSVTVEIWLSQSEGFIELVPVSKNQFIMDEHSVGISYQINIFALGEAHLSKHGTTFHWCFWPTMSSFAVSDWDQLRQVNHAFWSFLQPLKGTEWFRIRFVSNIRLYLELRPRLQVWKLLQVSRWVSPDQSLIYRKQLLLSPILLWCTQVSRHSAHSFRRL